ncbi:hypothetical protein VAWG006_08640 [Aeromonas enteropelogenes]|uniref:DUF3135 domain-containing protein n=1 Tax=Aeromonas sp. 19NY04SH05-1 TaxID=2920537 RepID=A0AAU6TB85_9GAMM|nr:DUF3135 domain-containing protein [Aeromonas enteropelogenes]MBL0520480.1 DUF3135 domain-containing protein [Aeromonas enteropelogenes]UBH50632.1 DUF3135 domain-containing protein [Aeromonas enteropelogenes]UBH58049.1 DUF3135 domain-containing protein [Aeromonas enteropelogenes]BEE16611.1 hypothetical protein VAWG006_08640 [Aeromonas enteropelogenes]BEE20774.1 hypothetical protein VAWG007_08690 [Aeromonas enteropelogenes]
MELPDFDTLKELAATEPAQLETILQQQIDELMARAGPEQQRRLLGLQFQIDGQRRLAKNNLDSCIRIANMMKDSFYLMQTEMMQFKEEELPDENDSSSKIVRLADYQHLK